MTSNKCPFRLATNVLLVALVSFVVYHPPSVALAFLLTAVPVPVPVVGVRQLGIISSSIVNNANSNGVAALSLSASGKRDEEEKEKDDADDVSPEILDVAIVGGGPTGLACALALLRATTSSSSSKSLSSSSSALPLPLRPSIAVFEADKFEPKGASIIISSPGWKALEAIDEETFREAKADGACVSSIYFEDFSGTSIMSRPLKYIMKFVIRPSLRYILRSGIVRSNNWHAFRSSLRRGVERAGSEHNNGNDGAIVRLNSVLVSVDPTYNNNSSVLLTFADGSKVAASTVLACDGTFSTIRKCLEYVDHTTTNDDADTTSRKLATPVLVDERKTVWRGIAPNIDTKGKSTFFVAQDEAKVTGGTAALFPAGRTTDGSSLSIILPSSCIEGRANGSDDARRQLKVALNALGVPIDDSLMETIDDVEYMIEHKLHVRDFDLFPNLYSGYDRIAYVGDSAHPLRPTGEGVAMSLEDAWTIGHLAAGGSSSSSTSILPPVLLRKYKECRQDRVAAVCKAVRGLAESYYEDDETNNDKEVDTKEKPKGKKKKPLQTTKKRVDQAMKDYPIDIVKLAS